MTLRIVLARHGRIEWDFETPIAGSAFEAWYRGENDAPIDRSHQPTRELQEVVATADRIVASPLRRSVESAKVLAPGVTPLVDPTFREAELPSRFRVNLRLRPEIWASLARAAWFCGWSDGVESFGSARARATRGAQSLIAQATPRGPVVLVGHGMMNLLVGARLRREGWRGPVWPRRFHWAFAAYERD